MIKRFNDEFDVTSCPSIDDRASNLIIDNLSTSPNENSRQLIPIGGMASTTRSITNITHPICADSPAIASHQSSLVQNIPENIKDFEKPMYKTDDKNFVVSKKHGTKNVEKLKIFGFNKRRPIYKKEDFDMISDINNLSTVFFEIDESALSNKLGVSSKDLDNVINENRVNSSLSCSMSSIKLIDDKKSGQKVQSTIDNFKYSSKKEASNESFGISDSVLSISGSRNSLLKRKGICSSQEMLHLVDIINDNISPEQVDVLAKSLIELGGSDSLTTESDHEIPDSATLLEQFPDVIDDKLLENIDAAIYENQIIFQERIRKNQLTIQNLKLQDQLLSKCIEDMKLVPYNETMSIRDYENMCFANIANENRGMKHWRNYLQHINSNQHDNSTVQHSSFYMNTNTNTITNSFTDLYVNGSDLTASNSNQKEQKVRANDASVAGGDDEFSSITAVVNNSEDESTMHVPGYTGHWPNPKQPPESRAANDICDNECPDENLYIYIVRPNTEAGARYTSQKNTLVETINKISVVDSPIKSLMMTPDKINNPAQ